MRVAREMHSWGVVGCIWGGFVLLSIASSSCDASGDDSLKMENMGQHPTTPVGCNSVEDTLVLDEIHNYSFIPNVAIKEFELQEYPNVPLIDWSNLSQDLLRREVNPADIGHAEVLIWNMDNSADLESWIEGDVVDAKKLFGVVSLEPEDLKGKTSAQLDEFNMFGADVQAEEYFQTDVASLTDGSLAYLLVLGRGTTLGADAVVAGFLKPVADSSAPKDLMIDENAISFSYDVSFSDKTYIVPQDGADTVLEWHDLIGQENALGQEFTSKHDDKIMLTFYREKSLEELQEEFLNLELIADKKYISEPMDTATVMLRDFATVEGEPFEGFGEEPGVWLLSLWCTDGCNNPAPKYLTVLETCSEQE